MILIIKMFCKAAIIILIVAECFADAGHRAQRSQVTDSAESDVIEEDISFSSMGVDVGEPRAVLNCPLDELILPKQAAKQNLSDPSINKLRQTIKNLINVNWLKDDSPFERRENGYQATCISASCILLQVGKSDAGTYTCVLDYSMVTRNFTSLFTFYRGANLDFNVLDVLPNGNPEITHPPSDSFPRNGTNVTFTCHRSERLSHQTTTWYRSCPLSDVVCNEQFKMKFDRAVIVEDPEEMNQFIISGSHGDELTITGVSENSTGFYACAVRNIMGADIRMAKLQLLEQMLAQGQEVRAHQSDRGELIRLCVVVFAILLIAILTSFIIYAMKLSILREKKQNQQQHNDPLITGGNVGSTTSQKGTNLRQHLPSLGCPNIYNMSKSADGCITGHLNQTAGHILTQSICSNILDKGNPSISSSNSQQSDEASSWGKSFCSQGDNCRNFYLHTSHTTATTMPMYDHPPSNGTLRHYNAMVHNSCVINPTYGYLRPENDASNWSFPRRNLERLDKIGEGQFGEVWRYIARHKDGKDDIVAVKQLKHRIGFGDRERLDLIAEIEIMKSVNNHPNVIKLLHYCVDNYEPILLIMEYAEHGKLQTYLRNCRASHRQYGCISESCRNDITSKELVKFTYHIAKGMEYVASKGIVHRDLASRNILVSKDRVCKVADFGFARRVSDDCAYQRTTTNPVPVKWMAPETLVENKFTTKSDVFSLGILMWEIVTLGATPYEQLSSEGVYKRVTTGGRLERPAHCSDEFYDLMAQCWLHDPALRPTFNEVAFELEKLLLSDNDYIKLDQYPEHAYYNIITTEEKQVVNI